MKEIITNKAVAFDAVKPLETSIILFKDLRMNYNVDVDSIIFSANSYKVTVVDEVEAHEYIRSHTRELKKAEINALYSQLTITGTPFTDRMNEELVKAYAYVINDENIFGLVTADLILR